MYKEKKNAAGVVVRYKSQLVAQGFTQKYGIDNDETYASVIEHSTIKLMFALAAQYNQKIEQGDVPTAYLLAGEVVGVGHIRIAAAALRSVCIDHALPQVKRIGLAVRGHELRGSCDVFAVRNIHLVQHAVPRDRIHRVFARRIGRADDGSCRDATGAKNAGTSTAVRGRRPAGLEMLVPDNLTLFDIDGVDVIGDAGLDGDLLRATGGIDGIHDQWRKQIVHLPGLIVEFEFPEELGVFNRVDGKNFFVFLPGGSLGITTVGQPVCAPKHHATERESNHGESSSHANLAKIRIVPANPRAFETTCPPV